MMNTHFSRALGMMKGRAFSCLLILAVMMICFAEASYAGSSTTNTMPTCTSDPKFDIKLPPAGAGIISGIVNSLTSVMTNVSQNLFVNLIANANFLKAVRGALFLYVAIYGAIFIWGPHQISTMDFTVRITKIALIIWVTSTTGWTFFNFYVVNFFNKGTDELIAKMAEIALGLGWVGINTVSTFGVFDNILAIFTSPKFFATLLATVFSGPYGIVFALLIFMGLGQFMGSLFQAMWIYLMSMLIRAFLFGLAPMFLCFLLFERTRHLFDGWLNQIVSACLQPIMLFAFFALFANLVYASIGVLLRYPVCLVAAPGGGVTGTPETATVWRFAPGGVRPVHELGFASDFPLKILDVMIFLLLVNLAWRFNSIVISIAKELAGASTNLDLSSKMHSATGGLQSVARMAFNKGGDKIGSTIRKNLPPPRPVIPPRRPPIR